MDVVTVIGAMAGVAAAIFGAWAVRQNTLATRRDTERNHVSWDLDHDPSGRWYIQNVGRDDAHDVFVSTWVGDTEQVVERDIVVAGESVPLPELRADSEPEAEPEPEPEPEPERPTNPLVPRFNVPYFDIPRIEIPVSIFSGYEVRWRSPTGRWSSARSSGIV